LLRVVNIGLSQMVNFRLTFPSKDSLQEVVKMADNKTAKTVKTKGPRMLPMVTLSNGQTYFVDDRLRQLRNTRNPSEYINDYESNISLQDLEEVQKHSDNFTQFVTITCSKCGKTLFNGPEEDEKRLIINCADCG